MSAYSVIGRMAMTATQKTASHVGAKIGTSLVAGFGSLAISNCVRDKAVEKARSTEMTEDQINKLNTDTQVKSVVISGIGAGLGVLAYECIKVAIDAL